jgi:hypothetical protein
MHPEAVTSPAPDMEPFEDESEIFGGDAGSDGRDADEEEDGEELFGDNLEA